MSCPGPLADDGLNPFSFKEFLRWKALDPDPDPDHGPHEEREPEQAHGQVRSSGSGRLAGLPHSFFDAGGVACAAGSLFLSELMQHRGLLLHSLTANLLCGQEAEETAWGRSLQLGVDSTASTCTEEEEEEEPR